MQVEELLEEWGVDKREEGEHEHARAGWVQVDCPYCTPQSEHFRLGINKAFLYAACWACGSVRIYDALAEITGKHWWQIKKLLGGVDTLASKSATKPRGHFKRPFGVTNGFGDPHWNYLSDRGFNPEYIRRIWKVRGTGWESELPWRLFIPVQVNGENVSWTTRGLNEEEPRYINADPAREKVSIKEVLYGEDYVGSSIIVHEGCTDVWRTGFGSVATMGLQYTPTQLALIARYPKRTICFDSSPDAQQRAGKLAVELMIFPGKTQLVELDAKDPGSASKKETKALRKHALGE